MIKEAQSAQQAVLGMDPVLGLAGREMTADEKAEHQRRNFAYIRSQFIHSQAVTLFQSGGSDDPQECWIRAVKFWESMPDDVREGITRF